MFHHFFKEQLKLANSLSVKKFFYFFEQKTIAAFNHAKEDLESQKRLFYLPNQISFWSKTNRSFCKEILFVLFRFNVVKMYKKKLHVLFRLELLSYFMSCHVRHIKETSK